MKIVIFGASGMLGSMVLDYLSRQDDFQVKATVRDEALITQIQNRYYGVEWTVIDVEQCNVKMMVDILGEASWAINAIGLIKPYIHDDNDSEIKKAIMINALFPQLLASAAQKTGCRVLQIATDCVYSGGKGHYNEADAHDALDVYGKTKSLGETFSSQMHHLRCSIIGPELKNHVSLLDWFLGQSPGSTINGFTNHKWNGITTLNFARICYGIIKHDVNLPHVHHLIPSGEVSKDQLLHCFAKEYKRNDITIKPFEAKIVVDRTLTTVNDNLNNQLWESAGYPTAPSVPAAVAELAVYKSNFQNR